MQGLDIFSTSWFVAIGGLLLAALIRGTTGFGFSLVFTPFMILIMEPKALPSSDWRRTAIHRNSFLST
jgi:uncharacterized membrane protein YfcA